jgi:hypothetical protein
MKPRSENASAAIESPLRSRLLALVVAFDGLRAIEVHFRPAPLRAGRTSLYDDPGIGVGGRGSFRTTVRSSPFPHGVR